MEHNEMIRTFILEGFKYGDGVRLTFNGKETITGLIGDNNIMYDIDKDTGEKIDSRVAILQLGNFESRRIPTIFYSKDIKELKRLFEKKPFETPLEHDQLELCIAGLKLLLKELRDSIDDTEATLRPTFSSICDNIRSTEALLWRMENVLSGEWKDIHGRPNKKPEKDASAK